MLRVIQISDCHLSADLAYEKHGVNTAEAFEAVLQDIHTQAKPDLIIASGDIAEHPSKAVYERFFDRLASFTCPIVCVPGNHDNKALLDKCIPAPPSGSGLERGGIDFKFWQIIGLDSNGPAKEPYGGYLNEVELNLLEQKLQASDKYSLLVMHHPLIVNEPGWLQQVKLENADVLYKLIGDYHQIKGLVSGHIHYAYDIELDGNLYLSCPSTYRQFNGQSTKFSLAVDSRPGYRKLCLMDNGQIVSEPCFIEWG
ncbi:MAG: metallophosphoesterase [Gammaproteobacteria bacterium]|nr:metallophosphoesterase [Gammaproteobacteria bacterium]